VIRETCLIQHGFAPLERSDQARRMTNSRARDGRLGHTLVGEGVTLGGQAAGGREDRGEVRQGRGLGTVLDAVAGGRHPGAGVDGLEVGVIDAVLRDGLWDRIGWVCFGGETRHMAASGLGRMRPTTF